VLSDTLVKAGGFAAESPDLELVALAAWSMVHRLTALALDGLVLQAVTVAERMLLAGKVPRTILVELIER
jgi:hypothetical protein